MTLLSCPNWKTLRGERDTTAEADSPDEDLKLAGRTTFAAEEQDDFNPPVFRRRRLHDKG